MSSRTSSSLSARSTAAAIRDPSWTTRSACAVGDAGVTADPRGAVEPCRGSAIAAVIGPPGRSHSPSRRAIEVSPSLVRTKTIRAGWQLAEVDLLLGDRLIGEAPVATLENCFPMIPSGKAHNDMLLPADANDEATAAAFAGGKALV